MTQDSATIIIKNDSKFKFSDYIIAVKGQTIGGQNLQPGQSTKFKISLTGNDLYRFTIYLDKNHRNKYSIEPIDYSSQVSETKINTGTYEYLINVDKKQGGLLIRLAKLD